jgi:nicotinate-nucleotide adenylyltransferase
LSSNDSSSAGKETSATVVFGGSFNPPHVAHALALCLAKAMLEPVRMLVIPTFQHPFAKALVPFSHRLAMCECAFNWIPGVQISRVEEELGGESRTLRTLQHVQAQNPSWSLRLLVGADILTESHKWFGWEQIEQLAPPLVLGRQGISVDGAPKPLLPEISSTEVRRKIAAHEDVGALVAKAVGAYIAEHDFYR